MGTERKDHRTQALDTQVGQRATVERHGIGGEKIERLNQRLREIGEELHFAKDTPSEKAVPYVGTIAVHIYQSEKLGQMFFLSQMPLGNTPEPTAALALADLRKQVMSYYGKNAGKKRSGF